MKKSELRNIIKEEIERVLSENGEYEARLEMILTPNYFRYKVTLYKDGEIETTYGPYDQYSDFDSEEEFINEIIPLIKQDYKLDKLYVTHKNDRSFKKIM